MKKYGGGRRKKKRKEVCQQHYFNFLPEDAHGNMAKLLDSIDFILIYSYLQPKLATVT